MSVDYQPIRRGGDAFAGQEREATRGAALAQCCPLPPLGCGARVGAPCVNHFTGRPLGRLAVAHPARIRAARDAYETEAQQ